MEKINLDSISCDPSIIRAITKFKQSSVCMNSKFQNIVTLDPELKHIMLDEYDTIVNSRMVEAFAKYVILNKADSIVTEHLHHSGEERRTITLFVLTSDELKHMVEYCISEMPESAINNIRLTKS